MADIQAKQVLDKPVSLPRTAPAAAPKAAAQSAPGRYLALSTGGLADMISFIRANLGNPHREMDGVSRTPVAARSAAASQTSVPEIKVTELGNINGAPQIASYPASIECKNVLGLIQLCRQAGVLS